jgi:hypothetical protein
MFASFYEILSRQSAHIFIFQQRKKIIFIDTERLTDNKVGRFFYFITEKG